MLLAAVGAWWAWNQSSNATDGTSVPTETAEMTAPIQRVSVVAPASVGAEIRGQVRRNGRGVGNAVVRLKGQTEWMVRTLDDGAFRFGPLPAEPVFLAASFENLASQVAGPISLEAGKAVEGVVLELNPTIALHGVVLDLVTRVPISKAMISWPAGATSTDERGHFDLPSAAGQAWLDVSAKGFLPRHEWISLEAAKAGERLELMLSPVSVLEGQVMEQGTARVGVTVWAELTEGARRGERSAMAITDQKGLFRIECSEGLRRLVAATPQGLVVSGPEVRVAFGERKSNLIVELGELHPVTGVVARGGMPLSGASLALINATTEDVVVRGSTFLDGRFVFDGVPAGRYLVQVRHEAVSTITGPYQNGLGAERWMIDVPVGQVVSGRVEPPQPNVSIRLRAGGWSGPVSETTTDEQGAFRFEGVPTGQLLVDAEGPQGSATGTAQAGQDIVLRLQRASISVRVVDESGSSVTDAVVVARAESTGAVRRYVLMAPDGRFLIDVPFGRWSLLAEATGRGRTASQTVVVDGSPVEAVLTLTAATAVRGLVIDKTSRLPIASARIRAESSLGRASVLSDGNGSFVLPPQPKEVQLTVGRDGYTPVAFFLPSRPDAANLMIELVASPNRTYQDETPRFEGVGMTLRPDPSRVVVQLVNEGSPAERAGIQAGDVIISIDGTPAGPDLAAVVSRIRGPAGTSVQIVFERNGQTFERVMRRRSLLMSAW
jgi:S1-C subfamily serine protease